MNSPEFKRDLTDVLNKHGIDSRKNTPDHELADFVIAILQLSPPEPANPKP